MKRLGIRSGMYTHRETRETSFGAVHLQFDVLNGGRGAGGVHLHVAALVALHVTISALVALFAPPSRQPSFADFAYRPAETERRCSPNQFRFLPPASLTQASVSPRRCGRCIYEASCLFSSNSFPVPSTEVPDSV